MLTKPVHGWTDFQLDNTSVYGLSYLDDIALDWLDQAIRGLETLLPFCVKGFLEPGRFLCLVSYWNCHIICEDDERQPLREVTQECSHTSMLQFCEHLYQDIQENIDAWADFANYDGSAETSRKKKERLTKDLAKLEALLASRKEYFGEGRCFL